MQNTKKSLPKFDEKVEDLYAKFETHSSVFRYLFAKGFNYYQISKITGKRPQHVRNVIITPVKK
jgi:hypothetical protein